MYFAWVATLLLPLLATATSHNIVARHADIAAKRANHLEKRVTGRATWYDVGLGACGRHNSSDQFVVALNSHQYGGGYPGPQCWKWISISCEGKSTSAQIVDLCPGCPYGAVDMSTSLFRYFAPLGKGVMSCNWSYGGGGGDPEPEPKPTTKKPPPPRPTSTRSRTRTSTRPTSTADDDTTSTRSRTRTRTSTTPTPTHSSVTDNIRDVYQAVIALGRVVIADAAN